ncbi:SHOCT domain-containing protein [Streptomyces sp. NPDC091268]|uniref:SHOCT domain-containing protein n=1 Tax=Streptomyces sp. NPDC091268 TaxID=3365979 RepID=UPI0037F58C1E
MFIRPVRVTVHSADRPAGRPLLRGLLARAAGAGAAGAAGGTEAAEAAGAAEGTVRADAPRRGVRWTPAGPTESAGAVGPVEPADPAEPAGAVGSVEPADPAEPAGSLKPSAGAAEPAEPASPTGSAGRTASAEPVRSAGAGGLVAELRELADLAREGLLTPEEFTAAKARLLGPDG